MKNMKNIEQLKNIGINSTKKLNWNLSELKLITKTITERQGVITSTGALACDTGEFTGRSPKDKYVVKDEKTTDSIWWGEVNHPFSPEDFDKLYNRVTTHLSDRDIYVKDVYACAKKEYQAWHHLGRDWLCHQLSLPCRCQPRLATCRVVPQRRRGL